MALNPCLYSDPKTPLTQSHDFLKFLRSATLLPSPKMEKKKQMKKAQDQGLLRTHGVRGENDQRPLPWQQCVSPDVDWMNQQRPPKNNEAKRVRPKDMLRTFWMLLYQVKKPLLPVWVANWKKLRKCPECPTVSPASMIHQSSFSGSRLPSLSPWRCYIS